MDNIAAIATGNQYSELGIIRLSGSSVVSALNGFIDVVDYKPRMYTPCYFTLKDNIAYPAGIVYFKAPHSYTGEDVIELHLPGNPVLLDDVCRELFKADVEPAQPGEFTKRAFLNGKMDLTQARSVMQLIQSSDESQRRHALTMLEGDTSDKLQKIAEGLVSVIGLLQASLEFSPDEIGAIDAQEIHQLLKNIIKMCQETTPSEGSQRSGNFTRVLITGASNTGKSSLFNALCKKRRSFVSPEPHSTRDSIEAVLDIGSGQVCLVDSCGTHLADDEFRYGLQKQYRNLIEQADVAIVCFNGSTAIDLEQINYYKNINLPKIAIITHRNTDLDLDNMLFIDLITGDGLGALNNALIDIVSKTNTASLGAQWSKSHADILERLEQALEMLQNDEPEEFAVTFLEEAKDILDNLRGSEVSEDILDGVFKRFCVGK